MGQDPHRHGPWLPGNRHRVRPDRQAGRAHLPRNRSPVDRARLRLLTAGQGVYDPTGGGPVRHCVQHREHEPPLGTDRRQGIGAQLLSYHRAGSRCRDYCGGGMLPARRMGPRSHYSAARVAGRARSTLTVRPLQLRLPRRSWLGIRHLVTRHQSEPDAAGGARARGYWTRVPHTRDP